MKHYIKAAYTVLLAAATLGLHSCSKHKDNTPATATGTLYFHLHTNIDTNEVGGYGEVYTTSAGRKVSLTIAQLYISHIQLVKEDGTIYEVPDTIVLKQLDPEQYLIGNVPVGNYTSVRFHVGLDSATNTQAATYNAALNNSNMWFGSTAQPDGYAFVNIKGKVDTTTDGSATADQMQAFMYKIGTQAHYTEVQMPVHSPVYAVNTTTSTYVHIVIDYNKLLDGVQLNNAMNLMVHTAADNSNAVSNTMAGNIAGMFSYEE